MTLKKGPNQNHPVILVVNTSVDKKFTEHTDNINNLIRKMDCSSETIHYPIMPTINLNDYAGIVLSPAAIGGKDDNRIIPDELGHKKEHIEKIRQFKNPVIGMCMGHQLIGLLYGSTLIKNKEREVGDGCLVTVINKDDVLLKGIKDKQISVKQEHNNSISLPKDFRLLMSSPNCRVQLMRHKTKPIYGAQFHLEQYEPLLYNFIKFILEDWKHKN